jgi:hypothetical protein
MCSMFKIFSEHIFFTKYIKYVCRLAVRYVLCIVYDISRLRVNVSTLCSLRGRD